MRPLVIVIAFCAVVFGKGKDEDCIKFNQEAPVYSGIELNAIKNYFPQISRIKPAAVATHILFSVKKNHDGYIFLFSDLEAMRSHECKESGLITMVMDGGFVVTINEKEKTIEWDPGESLEKPFKVQLDSMKNISK